MINKIKIEIKEINSFNEVFALEGFFWGGEMRSGGEGEIGDKGSGKKK